MNYTIPSGQPATSGTLTVATTGNLDSYANYCGTCGQFYSGYHCCSSSWPYWLTTYPTEPSTCIGKAHVFECQHEKKCKCGAVERVMPKPKGRSAS
jgi:hypothetical protein